MARYSKLYLIGDLGESMVLIRKKRRQENEK